MDLKNDIETLLGSQFSKRLFVLVAVRSRQQLATSSAFVYAIFLSPNLTQ